jgi:V/A-type H+-transporting ATPase subunit F
MKIFAISDNRDTFTGLRLVGINGAIVNSEDEFKVALNTIESDKQIGILLVTEKLAEKFHNYISDIKESNSLPLLLIIPDRYGSERYKDFATAYMKKSVGMKF